MPDHHDDDTHLPNPHRLRKLLTCAGLLVVLSSATTLAFASKRIVADQASAATSAASPCVPSTLNRSAVLPGTSLAVSPLPDSYDASPHTQISLLGAPAGALGDISVSGSRTGRHSGRLEAYSQGDGASFVPSKPFDSGETVNVRGRLTVAGKAQTIAFHFVVSTPDNLKYVPPGQVPANPAEVQRFHSRPELEPPALVISARSPSTSPGDLFSAPYSGPGQNGPMIFDEAGNVVWFNPVPSGDAASNFQVQQLDGKPVLTWWQGYIPPQGFGEGEEVVLNSDYDLVGRVYAGNGFKADLHDFHITPQDTAVLTVFDPIDCDLAAVGGPHNGAVTDAIFQEIDLRTGLVRREWHSLDHVPLSDSYSSAKTTSTEWPFDFFHLNSIDQLPSGRTLISARNTWTLYELNTLTGQILLRIGGKHSEVKLASGAATAFQHDATMLENGTISIFDNGGVPKVQPQSLGLVVSVNPTDKDRHAGGAVRTPQRALLRQPGQTSSSWPTATCSSAGAPSPTSPSSAPRGSSSSTATCTAPMSPTAPTASPGWERRATAPAIAAVPANAAVTVYASWNGATQVTSWRVLAGPSPECAHTGGHGRRRRLRDRDRHTRPRALRRGAGARILRRGYRHLQDDQGLDAYRSTWT